MDIEQIIALLTEGADIFYFPGSGLLGYPWDRPIAWINDGIQDEGDSQFIAQLHRSTDRIDEVVFQGKNGFDYYRLKLVNS